MAWRRLRVQVPSGPLKGPVAQLARAPVLRTGGYRFESGRVHKNIRISMKDSFIQRSKEVLFKPSIWICFETGGIPLELSKAEREIKKAKISEKSINYLIEKFIINPAILDYSQNKKSIDYATLMLQKERSEKDVLKILENINKEIDSIKSKVGDKIHFKERENWYHMINKNANENYKGELRIYLRVKDEFLAFVAKNIIENIHSFPNFCGLKINISDYERIDNLVIYFTEKTTKSEIEIFFKIIKEIEENFQRKNDSAFEFWPFNHPWGLGIHYGKITSTAKKIGLIEYFPLNTSKKEDLLITFPDERKFIASTPNDLFALLQKRAIEEYLKGEDINKIVKYLAETEIMLRSERFFKNPQENSNVFKLKDYIALCLGQLKNFIH
jgi:hypothetical protein